MILKYDECADVLWVSISEPSSSCVSVESKASGVILKVEKESGEIRGFQVIAWQRRINSKGAVLIPELNDPEFVSQWLLLLEKAKVS